MSEPYKRVLLKLSGEAFAEHGKGIDEKRLTDIVRQIADANAQNVEVAVVVGGGNFVRGAQLSHQAIRRITADHMGMMATVLNGLALRDAFESVGVHALLVSALPIPSIAPGIDNRQVHKALKDKQIVIFAGGTGNPFVTTDSAASLRAVEINADLLLKATKVDGVYDSDPQENPNAKRYEHISYDMALEKRLKIMDVAAFSQCKDYNVPIRVFNVF